MRRRTICLVLLDAADYTGGVEGGDVANAWRRLRFATVRIWGYVAGWLLVLALKIRAAAAHH